MRGCFLPGENGSIKCVRNVVSTCALMTSICSVVTQATARYRSPLSVNSVSSTREGAVRPYPVVNWGITHTGRFCGHAGAPAATERSSQARLNGGNKSHCTVQAINSFLV